MTKVHVLLEGEAVQEGGGILILWSRRSVENDRFEKVHSLPAIVERHADIWKSRYIAWIQRVASESSPNPRSGHQPNGLVPAGYWWLTLPSLPAFTLDSIPYALIRIWALVELLEDARPTSVTCSGDNSDVVQVLRSWCAASGTPFLWRRGRRSKERSWRAMTFRRLRNPHSRIVNVGVALTYLIRTALRYGRLVDDRPKLDAQPKIILFDYSYGLTLDPASKISCRSHYWSDLPDLMLDWGIPFSWVHLDVASAAAPRLRDRRRIVSEANNANVTVNHALLQDGHGIATWWRILRTYIELVRLYTPGVMNFSWAEDKESTDVSHIFRRHLTSANLGLMAAQNAIWIALTRKVAQTYAQIAPAVYLMENQPWELALIDAWQRQRGCKIFGVIHSTIRIWDTRFWLPLMLPDGYKASVTPNGVIANGPHAVEQLIANGYPARNVVPAEALRYTEGHLATTAVESSRLLPASPVLLVLGEYDMDAFQAQVELCRELANDVRCRNLTIHLRPHPSRSVDSRLLYGLATVDSSRSIRHDLAKAQLVLSSSMSSAVADAVLTGAKVISVPDDRYFPGLIVHESSSLFVGTSFEGVVSAIALASSCMEVARGPATSGELFYFGVERTRWRKALANITSGTLT